MTVTVEGPLARADFGEFDLQAYELFLRCKGLPESQLAYDWEEDRYSLTTPARFAPMLGVELPEREVTEANLSGHLFDYQAFIVRQALDARRYAIWADTGLGKTAMFLEWARHVVRHGAVVILSPLQVIEQTIAEAAHFYGDELRLEQLHTRDELAAFCESGTGVGITNYEKLIPGVLSELRLCAGLVLDESSILKTGGGKIKWNLIKSARGIEFKLSCTATPAPNDTMEYASQAAFLEKLRNEGEILWTFFSRDKRGVWSVKPHAREAFYRFMSSWSIYLRDPAAYGWKDILATLPPPEVHEYDLETTPEQRAEAETVLNAAGKGLFEERLGVRERGKLAQIARGFIYEGKNRTPRRIPSLKPGRVAEIVREERAAGRPTLVWTVFDEEGEIIREQLDADRLALVHGGMSQDKRSEAISAFRADEVDVLISKAQLLGYGLNFQRCRSMVFSGFDDSYERMYQAVRRAYRFGQTETVHVHLPVVPELEGVVAANLRRKQEQFENDVAIQEENYRAALGGAV